MGDRGSAVVEFALLLPIVIVVAVGIVEVAIVARAQLEVTNAAREGAREAATSPDPSRAVAAAKTVLPDASRASVAVRREHVVGGLAEVTVAVRHPIAQVLGGGWTVTLRSTTTMRVER